MRILIVEDDPNLGALWGQVFESAGHSVLLVDSEAAAMATLQTAAYDLVVLDNQESGRQTFAVAMMATYRNPRCKVVVVSGSANFPRQILVSQAPAVAAVLHKPVDIEDLVDVCGEVALNKRRVPQRDAAVGFCP